MNAKMAQAEAAFRSQPDVEAWENAVPLNPAHAPRDYPDSTALDAVRERVERVAARGLAKMTEFGKVPN